MSDISEHDSDSDTEIEKRKSSNASVPSTTALCSEANANESTTTSTSGGNIVEELKKQASAEAASSAASDQPEWQKYLAQNTETGAYTYTDTQDGTVYEWDAVKKGWIPKIDDDFIAMYQANYGFTATGEHNPNIHLDENAGEGEVGKDGEDKTEKDESENTDAGSKAATDSASSTKGSEENEDKSNKKGAKRKKEEEKKEWFDIDPKVNNNVYVSGIPPSTTSDEFVELMMKYGIIMEDDEGRLKVKLYKDSNGDLKGDGRCCYLKHESVVLACQMLDESDFNGSKIHVEQAVFQLKGDYNPSLKPKKKKKKKKKAEDQEKLLDWVDRPKKRSKFDRIVILKGMFDHKQFEQDPSLIIELKEDLRTECSKHGEVKKVLVFDRNEDGVASILFAEPEFADACIEALNGRYYAGKTVSAETYDGVTKYDVEETAEEEKKRLDDWENFLGVDDEEEQDR